MNSSRQLAPLLLKTRLSGPWMLSQTSRAALSSSSSAVPSHSEQKEHKVQLKHIPSLPLLGSLIPIFSGLTFDPNNFLSLWPQARQKYGDFYTMGIPGRGKGIHGTIHIVQDPNEMMKVLRVEGKYPTSSVQDLWSFQQIHEDYGYGRPGEILGHGEDWKLIRSFMQNDLLAPQSANRYLPGILQTVPYISKGMGRPEHASELNKFLQLASFDMFCSVLLGIYPRITDPDTKVDPVDEAFCYNVAHVISAGARMTLSPWENLLHTLNIKSKAYKELYAVWNKALDYGMNKISELETKKEQGTLSPSEEASYWNQAMNRWQTGDSGLTKDEVNKICLVLFNASVDTTSAKTAWHLLHVALNEEAQEKLHDEIYQNVQQSNGKITPEMFSPSRTPYLGAILRESNRLTCPANLSPMRRIDKDVEIHGHIIPAGSVVAFDQASKSIDPDFVDDPFAFRPERFLPDAVQSRKGTKAEFLDHPLFSGPFGQGARRCPGSRVARNESMALLAQCVLDWKMKVPNFKDYKDVPQALETLVAPKLPKFSFESRK